MATRSRPVLRAVLSEEPQRIQERQLACLRVQLLPRPPLLGALCAPAQVPAAAREWRPADSAIRQPTSHTAGEWRAGSSFDVAALARGGEGVGSGGEPPRRAVDEGGAGRWCAVIDPTDQAHPPLLSRAAAHPALPALPGGEGRRGLGNAGRQFAWQLRAMGGVAPPPRASRAPTAPLGGWGGGTCDRPLPCPTGWVACGRWLDQMAGDAHAHTHLSHLAPGWPCC